MFSLKCAFIAILVSSAFEVSCFNFPSFRTFQNLLPVVLKPLLSSLSYPVREVEIENSRLPKGFFLTGDLIRKEGFGYQNHTVITDDGYVLQLHRILSTYQNPNKFPVFIQHGVLAASDSWFLGHNESLPFLFTKNGYDVWIGDLRGNAYSKKHVQYNIRDERFWNFTYHETAMNDLPAFVNYILEVTKKPQLNYVGHSMGTTIFLTAASMKPEFNKKIRIAALLAPVATAPTLNELGSPPIRISLAYADSLRDSFLQRNIIEFFPRSSDTVRSVIKQCNRGSPLHDICLDVLGMSNGEHRTNIDRNTLGKKMSYMPAGTSTLTMHHLSQLYKTGFRQYDLGKDQNLMKYGTVEPPPYPLHKITSPVALLYGDNDVLVNERSVNELATQLPNLVVNMKLRDTKFTHSDFIFGMNALEICYLEVLKLVDSFQ